MPQRAFVRNRMSLAIVVWCLSVATALGAEYRDGRVEANEVIDDDLYIFGDEVIIDGQVNGDLLAFGRVIRMNGSVQGDFMGAAQAIVVEGKVGDDIRIAGQVLKIDREAEIVDDVFAAGFSLEVAPTSSIKGDLVYAGYQALLAGSVGENFNAALVNCEISGDVGGDVKLGVGVDQTGAQAYTAGSPPPISIPQVPPGLTIRETARIAGEMEYESPQEADTADGAQVGKVTYERSDAKEATPQTPAEKAWTVFGRYAGLLVVGACVLFAAPSWTRKLSDSIRTRPLASFGFGLGGIAVFIVLLPIILVAVIFFSVIAGFLNLTGLVPAVIVLGLTGGVLLVACFWFFTSYLAQIVVGFFAGSWILSSANTTLSQNRFVALLVGLVPLAVISCVPYLGSIVGWLIVVLGVGGLVGWLLWRPMAPDRTPTSV